SIAELLRGGPLGPCEIELSRLVDSIDDPRELPSAGAVKVKIGRAGRFADELAFLHGLRERWGHALQLRLDANGAWSLPGAREHLAALAELRPAFVEQPVGPEALLELRDSPIPLAADESLQVPGAAERLLESRSCAVFVLKPMVLGGLRRCFELGARAQARGIDCVVTHLYDGPVARAACAELALALPHPPLACGLAAHAGLADWRVTP